MPDLMLVPYRSIPIVMFDGFVHGGYVSSRTGNPRLWGNDYDENTQNGTHFGPINDLMLE